MKILEVSSAFPPSRGGVEMAVSELSNRLAARGHDVTVITSTRGGPPEYSDTYVGKIRVIRIPERLHIFEAPILPQILGRVLFSDFDILHVHGMSPTISDYGIVAGKIRRKRVVLTYHNDAESTMEWGIAKIAARVYARLCVPIVELADSIVCATDSYAESSLVLKHFKGRVEVIPLGVDAKRFANVRSRPASTVAKEVLFVGQLKEYKGVNYLIEAIAKLRQNGTKVALSVAGSGPSLPRLQAMVEAMDLRDCVRFLGNVENSELVDLYDSCDLVVLPSTGRREAFGLVQLEASAAGKAVVASDIPGVNDVNRKLGGYLAKPSDADSLALQIARALGVKHDPEKLKQAASAMSWDKVTTEYEELFLTLLRTGENEGIEPLTRPVGSSPMVLGARSLPSRAEGSGAANSKGRDAAEVRLTGTVTHRLTKLARWLSEKGYFVLGAVAALLLSIILVGSAAQLAG